MITKCKDQQKCPLQGEGNLRDGERSWAWLGQAAGPGVDPGQCSSDASHSWWPGTTCPGPCWRRVPGVDAQEIKTRRNREIPMGAGDGLDHAPPRSDQTVPCPPDLVQACPPEHQPHWLPSLGAASHIQKAPPAWPPAWALDGANPMMESLHSQTPQAEDPPMIPSHPRVLCFLKGFAFKTNCCY